MASPGQAKFIANRQRELAKLHQFAKGIDEDLPEYQPLFDEALDLSSGQATAKIESLYDEIVAFRRQHRITRWIGKDGRYELEPRAWPDDPHH
ncbi:hypothetical protein [Gordonia sputi]|uniref:Uncharacterized protein n=1 Tax=Gordonia sputi NBRC 100414 TaxID=1089453 RepID=H5U5G3_9ACTN|nr:hypothetical protein [Gordonia sputi]NKY94182.1 hypothetical protein [Gordonia sputi]GAB40971.1 hypothetical protein GOSPT_118_00480 [Gordonia sputi NBRC 100414]